MRLSVVREQLETGESLAVGMAGIQAFPAGTRA